MQTVLDRVLPVIWGDFDTEGERYVDGVTLIRRELPLVRDGKYAYFADINYSDKTVSIWNTAAHLARLRSALNYRGRAALDDSAFMSDMFAALDYWLDNDFQNPNWWHNQIGTATNLAVICLMLGDKLDGERLDKACRIISRGSISHNPPILQWTGANLIWGVRDTIYYALLTRDDKLLHQASERGAAELYIAEGLSEGIKPDMSFYQHGPHLYSGGYGRAFTVDVAQLIYMLSGTEFAFPAEKEKLFESFVLDGQRYITRGRSVDYLAIGREVARPDSMSSESFKTALRFMLKTPCYTRRSELEAFYAALCGEDSFSGTKYFPYSYYISHNQGAFHMAVKGNHSDFIDTEWGNGENLLGWNLSVGGSTSFISNSGEYNDIAPVWDYSFLPGVTSAVYSDEELFKMSGGGWAGRRGSNKDCGGKVENGRGALYMRLEQEGLSGLLTYIVFDGGMLCLGCELSSDKAINTTVDQCRMRDNAPRGKTVIARGGSVTNGAFRYFALDGDMVCEAGKVTGSWRRNSTAKSDKPVEADIFKLYIPHKQGEISAYAYAVTGGTELPAIRELYNDKNVQGVLFADGSEIKVKRTDGNVEIIL